MNPGEVIVFDVETTGTDRRADQVIELCVQRGLDPQDPGGHSRTWRFRPEVAISPGAQAVHGITMEDLAGCRSFAAHADEVRAVFASAEILVGYNMSFDIDMLQAEYERLRQPLLDLSGKQIIDPFRLWQQCEPRSLQHAHQRFVGDTFAAAHSAGADVAATGRVLQGMIRDFGLSGRDWGSIAQVCEPERSAWVGPSRHFRWSEDGGALVFGFGKHESKPVHALVRSENGGYVRWILGRDFPVHVHAICSKAIEIDSGDEFHTWVRDSLGGDAGDGSGDDGSGEAAGRR